MFSYQFYSHLLDISMIIIAGTFIPNQLQQLNINTQIKSRQHIITSYWACMRVIKLHIPFNKWKANSNSCLLYDLDSMEIMGTGWGDVFALIFCVVVLDSFEFDLNYDIFFNLNLSLYRQSFHLHTFKNTSGIHSSLIKT